MKKIFSNLKFPQVNYLVSQNEDLNDKEVKNKIINEILKKLNFPIFISSRKWERTNIFLQAIKNWHFRRRWLKGESLKSIYSDYYKK